MSEKVLVADEEIEQRLAVVLDLSQVLKREKIQDIGTIRTMLQEMENEKDDEGKALNDTTLKGEKVKSKKRTK